MVHADPVDDAFRLGSERFTDERRGAALDCLEDYLERQASKFLGYQLKQDLQANHDLGRFLRFHINNIGDPFIEGHCTVHSRWLERAVLDYYARLWHASIPADRNDASDDDYWGYVLSMGSTEGNIYAQRNARDYLDGNALRRDREGRGAISRTTYARATHPDDGANAYTPVAFYSEDTHYSHLKGMNILDIATFSDIGADRYPNDCPLPTDHLHTERGWPTGVPSMGGDAGPGIVDVDALAVLVEFFAAKGHPIFVCFNLGSTLKGAYDDVETACQRLRPIFEKYGLVDRKVHYDPDNPDIYDIRNGYWIHVDAALGGAYVPYLEMAHKAGKITQQPPIFDFRIPEVSSIVTSGHKYPGAPFPTGIYISKVGLMLMPPSEPAITATPDSTFGGSRNGLASIILWNDLAKHSETDHIETVVRTVALADYAAGRLRQLSDALRRRGEPGAEHGLAVGHTALSLSVWFRQPNDDIVAKYSLACSPLDGQDFCHIYVMPHVSRDLIDELIDDLGKPGAFNHESAQATQGPTVPVQATNHPEWRNQMNTQNAAAALQAAAAAPDQAAAALQAAAAGNSAALPDAAALQAAALAAAAPGGAQQAAAAAGALQAEALQAAAPAAAAAALQAAAAAPDAAAFQAAALAAAQPETAAQQGPAAQQAAAAQDAGALQAAAAAAALQAAAPAAAAAALQAAAAAPDAAAFQAAALKAATGSVTEG